jgi:hypothetical protein
LFHFEYNIRFKSSNFNFSDLESSFESEIVRTRKIPDHFTCARVEGMKCTFKSNFEVAFREHILTHIAEKLREKDLLID